MLICSARQQLEKWYCLIYRQYCKQTKLTWIRLLLDNQHNLDLSNDLHYLPRYVSCKTFPKNLKEYSKAKGRRVHCSKKKKKKKTLQVKPPAEMTDETLFPTAASENNINLHKILVVFLDEAAL